MEVLFNLTVGFFSISSPGPRYGGFNSHVTGNVTGPKFGTLPPISWPWGEN
jgi:hypothetical protein